MFGAHAVRMVAVGTLASMILLDRVVFWAIPVIAFVQGAGNIVFSVTSAGALRSVVPPRQLPAAAAVVTGREAAVSLAGPPLGGALFAIGRAIPFLVHAVSYVFATLALLAIRTPFQEKRERDDSPVRVRLAQGFRFVWEHPFIRTCAFLFGLANFIGPGVLLAIVVIGQEDGLSGGQVGVLLGAFSACLLLGSFLSPLVRRLLPVRGVLLLELWTWPGCALFLIWPNVYVLTASLLPTALAIPVDELRRRRLPARDDAGPSGRPGRERPEHDRALHRATGAARRRRPARRRIRAGHDRRLRCVRPRARRVGDAQPVDPRRAEPRRAGAGG